MNVRFSIFIAVLVAVANKVSGQAPVLDSVCHPDQLRQVIHVLAADSMQGRLSGSEGCNKAADFIADEFKKAGIRSVAGYNGYFMPVTDKWNNVVGVLPGSSRSGQLVIFSAHYDHVGTLSTNPYRFFYTDRENTGNNDTIYNGANDDASGVCALICLARYFAALDNNERTILFVAFGGEELGLVGSGLFSALCEPDSIKAVVNIEMIGRKYFPGGKPYMTGSDLSDLRDLLNTRLYENDPRGYGKAFIERDLFVKETLFQRSDNYPFAKRGVPAHTIMVSSPADKYYHSVKDEARTLDYQLMARIIKAIAIATRGLIDGTDSPSRLTPVK